MSEQSRHNSEFGSKPEDILAFNASIAAISEHNDQFSMGRMLARMLTVHLDAEQRISELVEGGVSPAEAEATIAWVDEDKITITEEQQIARDILGITNAAILDQTGLTISPLRSDGFIAANTGTFDIGKVRLQISDGGKFSGFLFSIKPSSADEVLQKNVTTVVENLVDETRDTLLANNMNDDYRTAVEALAYSEGIVNGMTQIGLGDSPTVQRLKALGEHTKQGDIIEYILADELLLFVEPGEQGFGPSNWQLDATGEFLAKKWGEVVSVLTRAKNNPNAAALFNQLIERAHANLDHSMQSWSKKQSETVYSSDENNYEYGAEFDTIFQAISKQLEELAPNFKPPRHT